MKIKLVLSVIIFTGTIGHHILLGQEAIVASGGDATGPSGSVAYSCGQVAYNTFGSLASIAQGVQQPYEIFVISKTENSIDGFSIQVYPNPTKDYLTIEIDDIPIEKAFTYQLFDEQGKLLKSNRIESAYTHISMRDLSSALYYLRIISNNSKTSGFQIIKTN